MDNEISLKCKFKQNGKQLIEKELTFSVQKTLGNFSK